MRSEIYPFYVEAFNQIRDILLVVDANDGSILYVNKKAMDFYGYSLEEFLSIDIFELNNLSKEQVINEMSKVKNSEKKTFNFKHQTKSGIIKDIEVYSNPIIYNGKKALLSQIRDLTDINMKKNFFENFVNNTPYAVAILDAFDRFEEVNADFTELFGFTNKEVYQKTPGETIHRDKSSFIDIRDKVHNKGFIQEKTCRFHKNGQEISVEITVFPIYYHEKIRKIAAIYRDISLEKQLMERLENEAKYDALTKVYNRRYGMRLLEKYFNLSIDRDSVFSILYVDINDLKKVNDQLGHESGDYLIIEVTNLLKQYLRRNDVISRLGGDEFLIILPGANHHILEKKIRQLEDYIELRNQQTDKAYDISIALGGATYTLDVKNIDELMRIADKEMYKDKMNKKRKDII